MSHRTSIRVQLPPHSVADRSYDIVVGSGLITEVGAAVAAGGGSRAVVIADAAVVRSHAAGVVGGLESAGLKTSLLTVASGETSKSIAALARLWGELAELAVDRQTHIVGVGGGVVGDLAGFAAATFGRGLPLWHVPTTVVAQVDSAIGGKTGINLDAGKNLVGCFWQPRGVFADVATLASLPEREFRSGLAEVVKYGVILDPAFFDWLVSAVPAILAREPAALERVVATSARHKAEVVAADELEITGLRAILNYGHTFAHAYETALGYGRLLHGEAVAIGMIDAAALARELGRIDAATEARQRALLVALGLPGELPAGAAVDTVGILAIMARDKKAVAGRLRFVLPTRIGHVALVDDVDPALVRSVLVRRGVRT